MRTTLAITRLLMDIERLGEQATAAALKQRGWTQFEIDEVIRLGLVTITAQGNLKLAQLGL